MAQYTGKCSFRAMTSTPTSSSTEYLALKTIEDKEIVRFSQLARELAGQIQQETSLPAGK